ncbi:Endo-1,4-beta-xylanase C [Fusarium oxysporum f. sp. albedinis]|nr:Endo-1,4-beta-xylanase C [Fusarium oxysporum f. sp. albedinis]
MFHSTCANARTSLETPCRSLIHSIDLPSESDLPNKYPRLLDSACACVPCRGLCFSLRPTSRLQSFPSSTSFPVASPVANRQYLWTISLPQDANIQQRGPQWTLCAIENQKSRLIRPFEPQTKI